jgi:quinol monooxygenase YgiN
MAQVCVIDWHVTPMRAERWQELWEPAAARALSFGASSYSLTRSIDDPLHYRQVSVWEDKSDFDRYWYSDEVSRIREQAIDLFQKPVLPSWHSIVADG